MKKLVAFSLLLLMITSCKINIITNIQTDLAISFEILKQEAYGGKENKTNVVIKSQQQLDTLYKELGLAAAPKVDFEKNNVVALFMGQKNTGGYSISIKGISIENDTTIVKIKETMPEGMAATVITAPYCIAIIPKTDKVEFD